MAWNLRQLVREEQVDITHTFFQTSDLWAAPIAKLGGCSTLVSSRRDLGILRTSMHNVAYRAVNPFFDRVLAVSDEVRAFCITNDHLKAERVETLYNGIDLSVLNVRAKEYDARSRLGLPSNVPLVSTLANIRFVKGLDVLVCAAARVCSEIPETVFLLAGTVLESGVYQDLCKLVKSLGLSNNVRFLGGVQNPYPILGSSDVFCLPSRSEGFSNALLEAMACGVPAVATRVGGNGEAITDDVTGYLVQSEDVDAMADRILRLLRSRDLRYRIAQAALRNVESRFSFSAMMTRLVQIYDELLAAKDA
jgi:glycosyltransferase involved in cell wall biosynthesis